MPLNKVGGGGKWVGAGSCLGGKIVDAGLYLSVFLGFVKVIWVDLMELGGITFMPSIRVFYGAPRNTLASRQHSGTMPGPPWHNRGHGWHKRATHAPLRAAASYNVRGTS